MPGFDSSYIDAVLLARNGDVFAILAVRQSHRKGWHLQTVNTPGFQSDAEEEEAASILGGLKESDYWEDCELIQEYAHLPSESELAEFLSFCHWHNVPEGYLIKRKWAVPLMVKAGLPHREE